MITLYSARACPYALRTRLALHEKHLDSEHIEIDLRNKPEGFTRLSPYGKVPALIDGDRCIYESAIINEYLDERYPDPPLMPDSPDLRAHARIWIDFANTRLMRAGGKLRFAKDEATRTQARDALAKHFALVAKELGDKTWFVNDVYSLVEVTYCTFFARKERLSDVDVPESVLAWLDRIGDRQAYKATGGLS